MQGLHFPHMRIELEIILCDDASGIFFWGVHLGLGEATPKS